MSPLFSLTGSSRSPLAALMRAAMVIHEVITTERVPFHYRVAGVGSRLLAWLVDFAVSMVLLGAAFFVGFVAEIGRAADAVGKKLKALSRTNQVVCVTHLPQIATFADHHYLIEKKRAGDRTRTTVRPITGNERTEEIARMLSGAKVTETSLKHAEQMLKANA